MGSFEDIRYDNIYSNGSYLFTLLHDQLTNRVAPGPSPVLFLKYVSLLKFITVYNDLVQCQADIHRNNQKMITLVLSDEGILEWNNTIYVTDNNIQEVHIFCHAFSRYLEMKRWNGCYRREIRSVHMPDTFERKLLLLGVDHIHQIQPEFRHERGMFRRLCVDAKELLAAYENYCQEQLDMLDNDATEDMP